MPGIFARVLYAVPLAVSHRMTYDIYIINGEKDAKGEAVKRGYDFCNKTVQKVKKAKKVQKGLAKLREVWYYT